jgi:hypothetical protein
VIVVPENTSSQLDLNFLEKQLILHQHRPLKLGSFSAGSNLTGVLVSFFFCFPFWPLALLLVSPEDPLLWTLFIEISFSSVTM